MADAREILIPLAAIALPVVLVPIVMTLKQAGKKREYAHLERMKALETGQPVPGECRWMGPLVCGLIGAGVPMFAFLFTFLAYVNSHHAPGEIWIAPVVTSFIALFAASNIGSKVLQPAPAASPEAYTEGKPAYDRDAYETVGR